MGLSKAKIVIPTTEHKRRIITLAERACVVREILYPSHRSGAVGEGLRGPRGFAALLWVQLLRSSPRSLCSNDEGSYRSIRPDADESSGFFLVWGQGWGEVSFTVFVEL